MWLLEVLDIALDHRLDEYGIEPRELDGLVGVVAAPFLHADFGHLIANTIPFLVLGIIIGLQGVARVLLVTGIVMLVSGLGTWLVAPDNSIHIGASGIVFGYAAYLLARGVFNRDVVEIAIGAGGRGDLGHRAAGRPRAAGRRVVAGPLLRRGRRRARRARAGTATARSI